MVDLLKSKEKKAVMEYKTKAIADGNFFSAAAAATFPIQTVYPKNESNF